MLRAFQRPTAAGASAGEQVLEDERAHTSATLQRIRVLTDKFAEQREEWLARQVKAEAVLRCLVGDVLLAAASLTYLGPLSEQYRRSLTREWVACAQVRRRGKKGSLPVFRMKRFEQRRGGFERVL